MLPLSPYEDYEYFRFADAMTVRLSYLLLDLTAGMDRIGVPVDALAVASRPFESGYAAARMNGRDHWMAAPEGASQIHHSRNDSEVSHLVPNCLEGVP